NTTHKQGACGGGKKKKKKKFFFFFFFFPPRDKTRKKTQKKGGGGGGVAFVKRADIYIVLSDSDIIKAEQQGYQHRKLLNA
ncbi:MAG: hypothetical protein FWE57_00570, partial [Chitinispirillia bacterium]|nr:hypothetical protein [Chitinispirillia bacterium]